MVRYNLIHRPNNYILSVLEPRKRSIEVKWSKVKSRFFVNNSVQNFRSETRQKLKPAHPILQIILAITMAAGLTVSKTDSGERVRSQ